MIDFKIPTVMDALVLEAAGQPLKLMKRPVPQAEPGMALILLKAAAFNRRDWWIFKGQYAGLKYPIILGSDGAGVVVAVGSDSDKDYLGKEVLINPGNNWPEDSEFQPAGFSILGLPEDGTFAEYVSVPVKNLYEKPEDWRFQEAAALPLAGLTAYRALFRKGMLKPGEKVLISGVGGGVASIALQMSLAIGAEVYVTSGDTAKIQKAVAQGASGGVNYRDKDWAESLKAHSAGFDLIVDSALGDGFAHFIDLANPGGRIVIYGGTAGNLPPMDGRKIFWKQIQLKGTTMGSSADFENMLRFCQDKGLRPLIDQELGFAEAEKGFETMNLSGQFGKIVLNF